MNLDSLKSRSKRENFPQSWAKTIIEPVISIELIGIPSTSTAHKLNTLFCTLLGFALAHGFDL